MAHFVLRLVAPAALMGLVGSTAYAEHVDYPTTVGVKGVELGHRQSGHNTLGTGIGAFVEHSFWNHDIELELSVVAAELEDHLVVPIDVLVKHDHELGHSVSVFAGAGASVIVEDEEGSHTTSGFAAAVGAHYWATAHWGIDMEVDYNLVLVGGSGQEISMAAGPVLRF